MNNATIFISHTTADDAIVAAIREALANAAWDGYPTNKCPYPEGFCVE